MTTTGVRTPIRYVWSASSREISFVFEVSEV
ncbi:hypothetical protein QFZ84_003441 [Pseudomonas fluorescens]